MQWQNWKIKFINIDKKYNREIGGKRGKLEKNNGKIGGEFLIFKIMVAKLENLKM